MGPRGKYRLIVSFIAETTPVSNGSHSIVHRARVLLECGHTSTVRLNVTRPARGSHCTSCMAAEA